MDLSSFKSHPISDVMGIRMWIDTKDPSTWVLDTEGRIMILLDKSGNYNHMVSPKPENRPTPPGYNHRAARRRRFWDRVCWWLMDRAAWISYGTWSRKKYEYWLHRSVKMRGLTRIGKREWTSRNKRRVPVEPGRHFDGWRPERYV